MGNAPRVFITGASGLLGKHLVQEAIGNGIQVLGQYHHHQPDPKKSCQWIRGDFSSQDTTQTFLNTHRELIENCDYLINNYGPITRKDISLLTGEDFMRDFFGNVIVPQEIIDYFLSHSSVKSIINLGFNQVHTFRPYRKILTYAIAKQGLLTLTLSLAREHQQVHFNMVSPGTMAGAAVKAPGAKPILPAKVAAEAIKLLLSDQTGQNLIVSNDG